MLHGGGGGLSCVLPAVWQPLALLNSIASPVLTIKNVCRHGLKFPWETMLPSVGSH